MDTRWLVKHRRPLIVAVVALLHLLVLLFLRIASPEGSAFKDDPAYTILKLVDVEEFVPPPPEVRVTTVYNQSAAAEEVIESEDLVVEVPDESFMRSEAEPDYVLQHRVSVIPEIPTREVLSRIVYPPIALRQGIVAVVYLELYIDQNGKVRRIEVLKDPGYGFAEAAVAALDGIVCRPALANGVPVAVRFRYPVRFSLN